MKQQLKSDTKAFILQRECKSINHNGFDTDLPRYYELFREGNKDDAKKLYRSSLEKKYPYREERIELMRSYRTKDPRFPYIYSKAINELAERLAGRITEHIDGIIDCFTDLGPNPMKVLKAIQKALKNYFPPNQDAAYDLVERLEEYSSAMEYREIEFLDAAELVKGYIDNTIFKSDEELREAKEKQQEELERSIEERNKKREERLNKKRKRYVIDLRKIQFSREDLAEIRIDSRLTRKAHKVLAYCKRYWLRVNDPEFERKIFLYSKKYNTVHYDIFRTVKQGRMRGVGDDVLLLEVFNLLSRGYEYSISEDLYMRKAWQRIKPVPQSPPAQVKAPGSRPRRNEAEARAASAEKPKKPATKPAPPPARKDPALAPVQKKNRKDSASPPQPEKARADGSSAGADRRQKTPQQRPKAKAKTETRDEGKKPVRKPASKRKPGDTAAESRPRPHKPALPAENRFDSGGARLKSLYEKVDSIKSGLFKNNHRLFRTKLVTFIEEYLIRDAVTLGSRKLDEKMLEEAKNIIYRFIMEHYTKQDYNWIGSDERKKVEQLGFLVSEVFTITTRCYNFVKDASVTEEYKRMARR